MNSPRTTLGSSQKGMNANVQREAKNCRPRRERVSPIELKTARGEHVDNRITVSMRNDLPAASHDDPNARPARIFAGLASSPSRVTVGRATEWLGRSIHLVKRRNAKRLPAALDGAPDVLGAGRFP